MSRKLELGYGVGAEYPTGGSSLRMLPRSILTGIRVVLYTVLAALEPLIVAGLRILALVLIAAMGFYGFLQLFHPSHFPFVMVAIGIVVCFATQVLFYAVMEVLRPSRQVPSR